MTNSPVAAALNKLTINYHYIFNQKFYQDIGKVTNNIGFSRISEIQDFTL